MSLPDRLVRSSRGVAALACLVIATTGSSAHPNAGGALRTASKSVRPFHLHLEKSEPANDQVLTQAPTVIRLWYSLPPELAVTVVKLTRADGAPVTTAAPHRGKESAANVDVDITQPLSAGSYVVTWKTASKDGHKVSGDFAFSIKAGA